METRDVYTMALFGEAEKGLYNTAYFFQTLPQLADSMGNPPPHSRGLYYAVQALLFRRQLLFFRVKEEGFSQQDYLAGLRFLETNAMNTHPIAAICLPGVGDSAIIQAVTPICKLYHAIMISSESDLYDYLTIELGH